MYSCKNCQLVLPVLWLLLIISCNNHKNEGEKKLIVDDPASMDASVKISLREILSSPNVSNSADSSFLSFHQVLNAYYGQQDYSPQWCSSEKWNPLSDSLINYIKSSRLEGLYPETYQLAKLESLRNHLRDSVESKDAVQWAQAELLFSNELCHLIQDLGQGRLQPDSLGWKMRADIYNNQFFDRVKNIFSAHSLTSVLDEVQPSHKGYLELKHGMSKFIDSMDERSYTYLVYPYKDSIAFVKKLGTRLAESGIDWGTQRLPDSAGLATGIKKYQQKKGIKADGKLTANLVKTLNNTDREKFKRIAITLDRYKQLPRQMPAKYIWVNLPSYYLKVISSDTVVFTSKIICGKPATPTPQISSAISDMIIYPTWTIPNSIIVKDKMLSGLQRNPGYLARKGFYLLNNKGEKVDPYAVNWSKYTKNIPFNVQQGSGDDNALGVIKFNFNNPYAVYLHDTNQRYLFANSSRSLSHGCVRVQDWQKLAFYLIRNDSILSSPRDSFKVNADSIVNWVAAKKKHTVLVWNKFPLFIRYFGCEAQNGNIKFYDDIYSDDKLLREKYFAGK